MRVIGRIIAGFLVVFALVAAAAIVFRGPVAGVLIGYGLRAAGAENPTVRVRNVSLNSLSLSEIQAGADRANPKVDIARADVAFDWRAALFERRVKSIALGPGAVIIDIAADGGASVAGLAFKGSGEPSSGLPFESIAITDLTVGVRAPEGSARGMVNGAFDPDQGGALTVKVETELLATDALRIESGAADLAITLKPTGNFTFAGAVGGDFVTAELAVREVLLAVDGDGASWRDVVAGATSGVAAAATIELQSADLPTAESPALAGLADPGQFSRGAINVISFAGGVGVDLADGRLTLRAAGGKPLNVKSDRGDALLIAGVGTAPMFEETQTHQRIGLTAALAGEALTGEATVRAERKHDAPWSFDLAASLSEQLIGGVSLGATSVTASGVAASDRLDADLAVSTTLRAATIGRLNIRDAAFSAVLRYAADFGAKEFSVSSLGEDCVSLKRAQFMLEGQDSDARLSDATLCRADGPLVVARWGAAPFAEVVGRLSARDARYRLGQTRFVGRPPMIDFTSRYDPHKQLTEVEGVLSGGRVLLNDALVGTDAAGDFTARLDGAALSGEAQIDRLKIAQNVETVMVAPIMARGTARLADDVIEFDYTGATPDGAPLGRGEGSHDIRAGTGETMFRSGRLEFAPRALQPAELIPALKGIIGDTAGAASGEARFIWGRKPEDFRSAADLSFENLAFRGPGVAVSKTVGLTGDLALVDLAPLQSDGPQSFSVKLVDLDALQLENGVINFYLPGDGTVRVIDADFPWFGGVIGAYETVASLTGESIDTALRARDVDLSQMLAFLNVKGLSGEGAVEGVLPLTIEGGKARINNGVLTATGPGVIRYTGQTADAAAESNEGARLAFDILRELHFEKLSAEINGPLDGDLSFKIIFEGTNEITVDNERVASPIIYRISIDAPLLALIDQARVSTDFLLQYERLQGQARSRQ